METTPDTDRHCIGLTQLSSREQLSALMDGMLPEDQTRFLLRRLQHDAELAGSWERWRIASD
ncbi:MAG: RseA family anti-sigma factor, partial [Thermomonas sp.]